MSYGSDKNEMEMMARLWMQGLSTYEIAQRYGYSEPYVYNRIDSVKAVARQLRQQEKT